MELTQLRVTPAWLSQWIKEREAREQLAINLGVWTLALSLLFSLPHLLAGSEPQDSRDPAGRSAGVPSASRLASQAREAENALVLRANTINPVSQLTYYHLTETLLARTGGQQIGVDAHKQLWRYSKRCWKKQRSVDQAPSARSILLPLYEKSLRWGKVERKPQGWTVSFSAERLGTYGAGQGRAVFDQGRLRSFAYQPAGADLAWKVELVYIYRPLSLDFQPVCA